MADTEISWVAPGAGTWELDATHRGRRPISPFLQDTLMREAGDGFTVVAEAYGLPLAEVRPALVNGCLYFRMIGVGEGDKPSKTPPAWVMKVLTRVHPELRRRNRTAIRAWEEKRWRAEVDNWFDRERATVVATNREFHRVDLGALDDAELVDQVQGRLAHFGAQARRNLVTHGGDLVPTGDFLAHCRRWGIDDAEATALLRGSSPASIETAMILAPVGKAIAEAGTTPESIEAVRELGDDARQAVDAWLELHGWRIITTDDIDRPTLAERPNVQLAALLAAVNAPADAAAPDADATRAKVPQAERDTFDALLVEARYGMRQRDDSVGVRWNWSAGLLRGALLECAKRLVARGALERADDVFELTPEELGALLTAGTGPTAAEIAARAEHRDRVEAAHAPDHLGPVEEPPPFDVFPPALARATAAIFAVMEAEGITKESAGNDLCGTGIGDSTYRGTARVATSADDALDRLTPGDVLVTSFTGPSYNSILPILGALVTDAGGTMCHAAIVAREFSLPAVVGATEATTRIPDGATVEVDPVAGRVSVLD
ncbi:MAG: PEP-utilizing enzyme [Acidimicrobiia bacterium]